MLVISHGVPKSGTTLAFEMLCAVFELHGYPQAKLPRHLVHAGAKVNFVNEWSDDGLAELIERAKGTAIAVKTHQPPLRRSKSRILDAVVAGDLRIHVVFRDPRDTVLAMLDAGVGVRRAGTFAPYGLLHTVDDAIAALGRQIEALRTWGWFPSLQLPYERFAFDPEWGPAAISEDVGMPVDPTAVWEIVDTRFTRRNVVRPHRHTTDMWPEEEARVRRAFPFYLDLVNGDPCVGWFREPQ